MLADKRCIITAKVTSTEAKLVAQHAAVEGLSLSNYIRRCINGAIIESNEDSELLTEVERGRPPTQYGPEVAAKAVRMRTAGMSFRRIAEQLGCSGWTVQRWISAASAQKS